MSFVVFQSEQSAGAKAGTVSKEHLATPADGPFHREGADRPASASGRNRLVADFERQSVFALVTHCNSQRSDMTIPARFVQITTNLVQCPSGPSVYTTEPKLEPERGTLPNLHA